MKKILFVVVLLAFCRLFGANIYLGSSTSGSVIYNYSPSEKRLYRGSSTSGSAVFTYEPGNNPRVYRGSSTSGSVACIFEYSGNSLIRMYRGSSTAGSVFAVVEKWDELPKPMLMFIITLIGE